METIRFRFVGVSKLMMHNERLANPFEPFQREIKKITGKKTNKTDRDMQDIAMLEFAGGLYTDPEIGLGEQKANVVIPTRALWRMLVDAGSPQKLGKKIRQGVTLAPVEYVALTYKGSTDLAKMFKDFRDVRTVVVGGKRVVRCRPCFHPPWSVEADYNYDPELVSSRDKMIELAQYAGKYIGLLDGRILGFGRFDVEVVA